MSNTPLLSPDAVRFWIAQQSASGKSPMAIALEAKSAHAPTDVYLDAFLKVFNGAWDILARGTPKGTPMAAFNTASSAVPLKKVWSVRGEGRLHLAVCSREIIRHMKRLNGVRRVLDDHGIHPLSIALAEERRPLAVSLAKRLGVDDVWVNAINGNGTVYLDNKPIEWLPGIWVPGDCTATRCANLRKIGPGLVVKKRLVITGSSLSIQEADDYEVGDKILPAPPKRKD